ncbi:hypothetical protein Anapl_02820 [Anas platyrhynchos]|uniref:Uncharacterized protein n=1 Tax=Anas platyrhynchos TaxID=8839 RepID=R0L2X6_ANAPL|nr:hypothetical protein Anapl_02820 [Anas platyrhynchos]
MTGNPLCCFPHLTGTAKQLDHADAQFQGRRKQHGHKLEHLDIKPYQSPQCESSCTAGSQNPGSGHMQRANSEHLADPAESSKQHPSSAQTSCSPPPEPRALPVR